MKTCLKCDKELVKRQQKFCGRVCFFSSPVWTNTQKKKGEVHPLKGSGLSRQEHNRKFYEKNKEKINARGKLYYRKNIAAVKATNQKWAENNRDKIRVINKRWREKNKAQKQAWCYERRALKRNAIVQSSDKEKIRQFYILAETLTIQTGIKYCVDHIRPLIKGGLHHQDNLQVITLIENSRKGSKYPFKVEEAFIPSKLLNKVTVA